LYCGVTKDIENRLIQHNKGTGSRYTRSRRPVELAAVRNNFTKSQAYKMEYQIKKLPAAKKISYLNTWDFEQWISQGHPAPIHG